MDAAGVQKRQQLVQAGFSNDEIGQWETTTRAELAGAGFSEQEQNDYFGVKTPDMAPMKAYLKEGLEKAKAEKASAQPNPDQPLKVADGILESLDAGWQMSVSGLLAHGRPDVVMPENAPAMARVASQISTLAGDLPAMVAGWAGGATAGAAAGGVVGSVVPGLGTLAGVGAGSAVGGTSGAFAAPAALRKILMDHYEKGDVQSFGDFWERSSAALWEATKQGAVGAVTGGVGRAVGVATSGLAPVVNSGATVGAEIATMVSAGSAIEGHMPQPQDFMDAGLVIATVSGVARVPMLASKLRGIYAETGERPGSIARRIQEDPILKQEVLSENQRLPKPEAVAKIDAPTAIVVPERFFQEPTGKGNIEIPRLGDLDLAMIGAESKPVVIKENIAIKNLQRHPEVAGQDIGILQDALYNPTHIIQSQPEGKPNYYTFIKRNGKNKISVIELNSNKENYEVVNWYQVDQAGFEKIEKRAGREGGQFLITERYKPQGAADLSALPPSETNLTQEVGSNNKAVIERSSAEEKILSKIGSAGDGAGSAPIRERITQTADAFYRNFIDKLDPIKKASEELGARGDAAADPYLLSRMVNDAPAKTVHAIEHGTIDFKTLARNGKGMAEITQPFKDDIQGFEAYLVSKRAIEVEARGKKSGFDVEAAREVVAKGDAKYGAAAKELVEFQNRNLQYLRDAGVISDNAFDAMKSAGEAYIPFSRLMDHEAAGGTKQGKPKSLKAFEGSDRNIQSPMLSILQNTETIMEVAERNRAVRALVDAAEKVEGQELIRKAPSEMRPIEVKASELQKMFDEQGIEASAESLTVFRRESRPLRDNQFEVFRDGKREVFEAEPALVEAVNTLGGNTAPMNLAMRMARGITVAKKIGISFTPDFVIRNLFRDYLTSGTFSKEGRMSITEIGSAMGNLWRRDQQFYTWLKSGGANGAFLDINKSYLEQNVLKLSKQTGFADAAWNVVKTPVHALKVAAELSEQSIRLAEFKRTAKGASSGSAIFEGGFNAREITVDFQRVGAKVQALNAITAFMNVGIQGLDRTARAIKENPVGTTTKALTYITAPSVLLWYANKDDKRVQEIPRWERDLNWIVATDKWEPIEASAAEGMPEHLLRQGKNGLEVNNGAIFRFPKPQELGILFGTIPERLLESFATDHPHAMEDLAKTITGIVSPSFIPDAISAPLEHYMNKSFFTDAPIIPGPLEKIAPEYQYTDYTTDTSKALGKLIGYIPGAKDTSFQSPMVIENYTRAWGGTLGMYALQVADKGLRAAGIAPEQAERASMTLADIPAVKSFVVRYPSAKAQSITDFLDRVKENERNINTVKFLAKEGNLDAMEKEMSLRGQEGGLANLKGVAQAISSQTALIRKINRNPEIPGPEKRQLIDKIYFMMIESAKAGNKMFDQLSEE